MTTQQDRIDAGARWTAAVTELRAAYIHLFSIDLRLRMVVGANTFRGDFDQIPWEIRHPQFSPGHQSGIVNEVKARKEQLENE